MKRDHIRVVFCREYGDESLPLLRELVSEKPDEKKAVILDYLRTHCILASPGVVRDILDPPYNTGSDFVYEDDFVENAESYLGRSGQFDEQGNKLEQNMESKGRFHAVFRDSSMADDSTDTNFDQIFETYSPSTVKKVL